MSSHRGRSAFRTMSVMLLAFQNVSLACAALHDAAGPSLLPRPVKIEIAAGQFILTPATEILYTQGEERLADAAEYLAGRLSLAFGKQVAATPTDATDRVPGAVLMTVSGADPTLGDEGYSLKVTADAIVIRAPKAAGAFYGGISLLQLTSPEAFRAPAMVDGKLGGRPAVAPPRPADEPNYSRAEPVGQLVIPCATVWDHPRFAWRGLLIDPARHFWTIDELKQYVDYLAIHKLNRLQIHFTDHENWTVEVNRYPNLTPEKQRNATDSSRETNQTYQNLARHYYTHDELRSLLAFAAKRFVTIVPEFEMPGHCGGLLRGCPECGCTVDAQKVGGGEVCPGQEKTYEILQNILDEMLEVFPGQYVHIGADECGKENWKTCADCQKRMRDEGLQSVTELHGYFVSRMADYLRAKGRTLVGWDEILESGAKPGAVGMYWRSGQADELVRKAADHGQFLVMTPTAHCYFDYWQSPEKEHEPQGFGDAVITLRRAYELQPLPAYIRRLNPQLVLGAQANLWGERMQSFPHVLYQTYPRACALTEIVWSPEPGAGDNYAEFFQRLQTHLRRLDAAGIKYRAPTAIDEPGK